MSTLITGGTGKTGFALAKLLHASNKSFLIASRSGTAPEPFSDKAVKFDWLDESTFENTLQANQGIDRMYLVAPNVEDPFPSMKKFVDLAVFKGVKRFVLCGGSGSKKGIGYYGKLHEYFDTIGVEYTVLLPTWFTENFGTIWNYEISQNSTVSTIAKDGRVPFVSAEDVAQAAYDALTSEKSTNSDPFVFGPTLYSFDEALALLSEVTGRKITHKRVTFDERKATYESFRLPKSVVEILLSNEADTAKGVEESRVGGSNVFTGKHELKDYFEANKSLWKV